MNSGFVAEGGRWWALSGPRDASRTRFVSFQRPSNCFTPSKRLELSCVSRVLTLARCGCRCCVREDLRWNNNLTSALAKYITHARWTNLKTGQESKFSHLLTITKTCNNDFLEGLSQNFYDPRIHQKWTPTECLSVSECRVRFRLQKWALVFRRA